MMSEIKSDFPIFQNYPDLVFLDNASTTQTPQSVLRAMNEYYSRYRANVHRGVYKISDLATEKYEQARSRVASFIKAEANEIIFTSGTTAALNGLAAVLMKELEPGDNIVLTRMEHHANLVPWQEAARKRKFEIRLVELTSDFGLQTSSLPIDAKTKIVSFTQVSNTLGTINSVKEIIAWAKKFGALTVIDSAQGAAHLPLDVKALDCDFLVFSGHKMYGPTGIGVLYGKRERLEAMEPFAFGGDMVSEVTYDQASWNNVPWRFEAGTPNIAGAIGLAAAIDYIEKIGLEKIVKHEQELTDCALERLSEINGLRIIGPDLTPAKSTPMKGRNLATRIGIISFTMNGIHPHDVATILDSDQIAVRAGHHCTMPLMKYLGVSGTTRVSFGLYNLREDVDRLVEGLKRVEKIFKTYG